MKEGRKAICYAITHVVDDYWCGGNYITLDYMSTAAAAPSIEFRDL